MSQAPAATPRESSACAPMELQLSVAGPGMPKQRIPGSMPFRPAEG